MMGLILTYGRVDGIICRAIGPALLRVSKPFGNFRLARMLTALAVAFDFVWDFFTSPSFYNLAGDVIFGTVYLMFWIHGAVRPLEKMTANIAGDDGTLRVPLELFKLIRTIARMRMYLLCICPIDLLSRNIGSIITQVLFILGAYVTTCIQPRRKSRIAAKARAFAASLRAATPRLAPVGV